MMWVQHHNGIFRSTDRAASWTEIADVKPSAFGFAVAVHPRDPETAWFVPAVKDECRLPVNAQLVVTRTRNGGQSFPKSCVPDCLKKTVTICLPTLFGRRCFGQQACYGLTTGGLWTSAKSG